MYQRPPLRDSCCLLGVREGFAGGGANLGTGRDKIKARVRAFIASVFLSRPYHRPFSHKNRVLDYSRRAPHILQVRCRLLRNLFQSAGRFAGPFRFPAGRLGRDTAGTSGSRLFLLSLGCRLVVGLSGIFARKPAFQRRQLRTILQHFPEQAALGVNRPSLLDHQQGQNPIRNQKQNNQQRKQSAPRLPLRNFTLCGVDDCQGAPKLPERWAVLRSAPADPSGR